MRLERYKFLELLFDSEQSTCFSSSAKGTRVRQLPVDEDIFFSVNALHPDKDLAPTEEYHNPTVGRRADANVTCFRNFLIELDDYPLEEQVEYVLSTFPVSTIVFSGKKSYHFIISIEEPLSDYETYSLWASAILKTLPHADQACKNPSRLSRLPSVIRPDTGNEQLLYMLKDRVPNEDIKRVIAPYLRKKVETKDASVDKSRVSVLLMSAIDNPEKYVIMRGGRDNYFYWLSHRFNEMGIGRDARRALVDRAYMNLDDKKDFKIKDAYRAARVRYRR